MAVNTRKKNITKEPIKKKLCQGDCKKERAYTYFFKVDSQMFPDGMINICRDCVRSTVDIDDTESVIGFLRQIDKPFYKDEWDKAMSTRDKKHPMGAYMQKLALQQYKGKTFNNSDGVDGVGKVDLSSINSPETIESNNGKVIKYSQELVDKWGVGYNKTEYLQLEKFSQDMKATHEIYTPTHIDALTQLSYLSVDRNRLRREKDWNNYKKVSDAYEVMMKSAGFRPVDRQGIDDATGIRSFSQIFEEVEKRGFRKPAPKVFRQDITDGMIISLANYYHRIVGKEILNQIPDEIKQEMEEFFKDDLEPVEINDSDYDDLDFSINDEDEDEDEKDLDEVEDNE